MSIAAGSEKGISVMNSDFGLDGKSDATGEAEEARARVSEGGVGEDGARVSPMELDSGGEAGGRSEEDRARVSTESEVGNVDKVMESKGSGIQVDRTRVEISFNDDEDDVFDISRVEIDDDSDKFEAHNGEHPSLLSEFDEFVANEKSGMALGTTRALSYGFEVGDMVWGKVKSHPWWPGHIFNEALATSQVRRTRREGYVLVAFFGDNSYGWFDPAELIPFDPHYAEKSRQTSHRGFLKAVEEAVDEANRRCGVGLACKCRNAYNFRSTSVQGYFVVDVPDYEPGAVYSENQIRKARDSLKPIEILSFVKQLALSPLGDDQKSLSFSKSKATAFSFRRAVFEEYDETYAQAFGAHPGRPSRSLAPAPTRAALSGPLVIAEVLGGRKTATKPMKVKDHSKRDKYLFKRRDEPGNSKTHQTSQGQASSSAPSAVLEGSIALADDNYMLQKRVPDVSGKEAVIIDQAPNSSLTTRDVTVDAKPSLEKGRGDLQEVKEGDGDVGPTTTGYVDLLGEGTKQRIVDGTSQPLKQEGEGVFEVKYEESEKLSGSFEKLKQPSNSLKKEEGGYERGVGDPLPIEAKSLGGKKAAGGVKKLKVLKRPAEDLDTKDSMMGDKKKKKKKKQLSAEASVRNQQKPLTSGKVLPSGSKEAGNANHVGLAPREDTPVEHKKDVTSSSNLSESVGKLPIHVLENVQLELSQLVSDLKALALDPFHGIETNSPTIVRQFFLHFRSLVYQKSLVLSPPSETESVEGRSSKSSSGVKASDISPTEQVRDLSSSKPAKPMFRSDDPTIAGRKRAPSDRQGDIAAKRNKKITDIRTLASEKKAIQRPPIDSKRVEAKESATPVMRKSLKPGFAKKADPASKAVEPTMLVLKFPPKISLPSPAELKAKFARFGPMDQSGLRVFWKSSTCRVVFLYKSDAHAAFKFATANSSLFGNFSVRCQIREVGGPEVPEFDKGDNPRDTPRAKDPLVGQSPALASALRQQQRQAQQSAVQLKSILKKSSGEESAGGQVTGGNGNSKGTARVKFMLGREETSRTTTSDQFMMPGNRNNNFNKNNNSASFADVDGAPSSTSSIAMDFNTSRNLQKVNPPPTFSSPLPPLLPNPPGPPPQYAKPPPHSNFPQHSEMAPPRYTSHNLNAPPTAFPSTPTSTVDISQQMLSLLISCSDVVSNVQGLLGYLPYHPL